MTLVPVLMLDDLLAGAATGLAVALPIGAIGTYLVALAARDRRPVAIAAALGVATTDGLYAVLAGVGGAALQRPIAAVVPYLRVIAAILLVLLALRTARLAVLAYRRFQPAPDALKPTPRELTPLAAYAALVALTAINPATILTFSAVVLGRRVAATGVVWFATGALAASAAWQLVLVAGGSVLGHLLRGRRGQLAIALVSAAIMLVLAGIVLAN